MTFTLDEAFAIVNGRTPLVDFSSQYGSLLSWVGALAMLAFGKTTLVFTIAMCTLTALALLAIYDVLRRVTRSPLAALALYLPFLATSLYKVRGTAVDRDTFGDVLRRLPACAIAGPYVLAWLTTRQLEQRGERARNLAALRRRRPRAAQQPRASGSRARRQRRRDRLWTIRPTADDCCASARMPARASRRARARVARSRCCAPARCRSCGGCATTRSCTPRQLRDAADAPLLGLHVAIYVTYVAAIATATVAHRQRRSEPAADRHARLERASSGSVPAATSSAARTRKR